MKNIKKSDIIVERAEKVIKMLGLTEKTHRLLGYYTKHPKANYYEENTVKQCILKLASDNSEKMYPFVNKILKQIDLLLLE